MQRNVVAASTFAEADDHVTFWQDKTVWERLNAACFILNKIFSVLPTIKVQKHIVTPRKHSNG
jgi:hypothetical protein